jgi:hypothetical protein
MISSKGQVALGVQSGLTISNLRLTTEDLKRSNGSGYGLTVGVNAKIPLCNDFHIQPEVNYVQFFSDMNPGGSQVNNQYLTFPVLIGYQIKDFIHLQTGPQFGVLVSSSLSGNPPSNNYFNKTDFGALFNVGLDWRKFNLDIRYYVGLSNINKKGYGIIDDSTFSGISPGEPTYQNLSFQVLVGYKIFK